MRLRPVFDGSSRHEGPLRFHSTNQALGARRLFEALRRQTPAAQGKMLKQQVFLGAARNRPQLQSLKRDTFQA